MSVVEGWTGASPLPSPGPSPEGGLHGTWGGLKYLANISVIGGISCILLFLLVKLQDDHRLPHPVHLVSKLIAVWKTTDDQIARLCGADASDYLALLRVIFFMLALLAVPGLLLLLPVHIRFGDVPINDELVAATVSHLRSGSPWLWLHVAFVCGVCVVVHSSLEWLETRLQAARFRQGGALDTISAFTVMIRGVPRGLTRDKQTLVDYFEHLYPGKIYHVCIPQDLVTYLSIRESLLNLERHLVKARAKAQAEAAEENHTSQKSEYRGWVNDDGDEDLDFYQPLASAVGEGMGLVLSEEEEDNIFVGSSRRRLCGVPVRSFAFLKTHFWQFWRDSSQPKSDWQRIFWLLGAWHWRDEVLFLEKKIIASKVVLHEFEEVRARGAGIAFIVFKDVFTATRAIRDAAWKAPRRQCPPLATHRWHAERAPPPAKVQWDHVGSSAVGRRIRSFLVNCAVLIVLVFWSSPLAMVTAMNSATERLDPEAVQHFHSWLAWAKGSSWLAALLFQFLPNALTFFTMYTYIPRFLSYLAKFECHLTVSGEQQAVLVKMVCFFLVNLFLLKALVETTLESAILHFGQCYVKPSGCPSVDLWLSRTFIGSSSLSALAFLITSSLLGVSVDLLSPLWMIKRQLRRFKGSRDPDGTTSSSLTGGVVGNDVLELNEPLSSSSLGDYVGPNELPDTDGIEVTRLFESDAIDRPGLPLSTTKPTPEKATLSFDFPQYHSYNLTAFAMALTYSVAAPLVLPAGAFFFFYRLCVDKYNFLFIYRSLASPAVTDGRLVGTVLKVMRVMLCSYLGAMVVFFAIRGDQERLQMLITLLVLFVLCAKYGVEKFVGLPEEKSLDGFFIQELGSVDQVLQGGMVGYELMSRIRKTRVVDVS